MANFTPTHHRLSVPMGTLGGDPTDSLLLKGKALGENSLVYLDRTLHPWIDIHPWISILKEKWRIYYAYLPLGPKGQVRKWGSYPNCGTKLCYRLNLGPLFFRMPPICELTLHTHSLCIRFMMGQLSMLNHTIKVGVKGPQVVGCFEYKGPYKGPLPQVGVMGGPKFFGMPYFKGLTPHRARRLRCNKQP